jgi:hypothetical protein
MRVRQLRLCRIVAALSAVALFAGSVRADILYQTGFESPTYSVGNLAGQDGWFLGNGQVENTTVLSGSQALSTTVDSSSSGTNNLVAHPVFYDSSANPAAIVRLQVSLLLQGNLDGSLQYEGIAVFAANTGAFVGQISGNGGILYSSGPTNYSLEMDLDFQTQTLTAFVDGTQIEDDAFATPMTQLGSLELGGFSTGSADFTAYYDDLTISVDTVAAPAPGSIGLFAIGATALTGWRRFNRRQRKRSATFGLSPVTEQKGDRHVY